MPRTIAHGPSLGPTRAYPRRFLGRVGRTPLSPTLTWRWFQMPSRKGVKNRLYSTNTYQRTLHVYQPFEPVMEKLGEKARSSEQAMVLVEAYISMVSGSSSEEDSETDDQSYISPEVYALSCNVYISHMMHMVCCSA